MRNSMANDETGCVRFLDASGTELLKLSASGAWVRGEQVSASGDTWRAFQEWVREGTKLPGTPRRLSDRTVRDLASRWRLTYDPRGKDVYDVGVTIQSWLERGAEGGWDALREFLVARGAAVENAVVSSMEVGGIEVLTCIQMLAREVLRLRRELRRAYANNAERNRALEALMWQWCGAACEDGRHAYRHRLPLTEGLVRLAEESAAGLRSRYQRLILRAAGVGQLCERCNRIVLGQRHDCVMR